MLRSRMGELRTIDGDAPTRQPAQQAKHHGQVDFLGDAARLRVWLAVVQADHGAVAAYRQAAADIPQEQAEAAQALAQRLAEVVRLDQAAADQGKAALGHAVRIMAEELVVQFPGDGQPQLGQLRGGDPRLGVCQQRLGNARLGQ
ncbi:hypothetical protein D3C85_637930 [compost metagenome]